MALEEILWNPIFLPADQIGPIFRTSNGTGPTFLAADQIGPIFRTANGTGPIFLSAGATVLAAAPAGSGGCGSIGSAAIVRGSLDIGSAWLLDCLGPPIRGDSHPVRRYSGSIGHTSRVGRSFFLAGCVLRAGSAVLAGSFILATAAPHHCGHGGRACGRRVLDL
jgi:hypothetical protein